MANPKAAESGAALRMLPSTDDLLTSMLARELLPEIGQKRLAALARTAIESIRKELANEISNSAGREKGHSKESLTADALRRLDELWKSQRATRLRKVINATGVVVHTNLGRAPLSENAISAVRDVAGYCTLEYDLRSGKRGKRGAHVEGLLSEVTGAEAALVVNNCAAAAFLVLAAFAKGGEVVLSRGELVEIGGDFRIPDVLTQSGATLREVGTTNRTKLADYKKAIGENTRLLMRVHPSNYRIVGFTEKPSRPELADLAHDNGIILYEDAGSGAMVDLANLGFDDEPVISAAIADGADIVTFSGDKLLGGSQAGLIVGRRDLIEQIRKHPLYRALRVDKLIYAVLEATLESYLREDAGENIPVLRMLGATRQEIDDRARGFAGRLRDALGKERDVSIETVDGESVVGGGSAPAEGRPTMLLALRHSAISADAIERKLRMAETPVIARIENDAVLVDLRTVHVDEEDVLLDAVKSALVG